MNYTHQFFNDYSETAHPACLQAVAYQPQQQQIGYGLDDISARARDLIQAQIHAPAAEIHFCSKRI